MSHRVLIGTKSAGRPPPNSYAQIGAREQSVVAPDRVHVHAGYTAISRTGLAPAAPALRLSLRRSVIRRGRAPRELAKSLNEIGFAGGCSRAPVTSRSPDGIVA